MIRPALTAWHDVTEQLLAATRRNGEAERDEVIQEIEGLLDARDKLQPHVAAPHTPEEEAFGKDLMVLEQKVQQQLAAFLKQIRHNITETQAKKDNMKSYVNPYSNLGRDGGYYDTKQ
ncbi:hypothetical protein AB1K83_07560 [Sporosarcina sp. 179-K 3D1 HS]|uniref:hypothetical protein n=1 Tax=Sporosarcina sp. 179-K 3D1 HS TaxID=3232169 RepID=UPI00399FCDF2